MHDPFEELYGKIGKLIVKHAEVEQMLYVLLIKISGKPTLRAYDMFTNDARIAASKTAIKKIFAEYDERLPRSDEIFAQLTIISKIRNAFSHYQCATDGRKIVIDTSIIYNEKGVRNELMMTDFDDIYFDIEIIRLWIISWLLLGAQQTPAAQVAASGALVPFRYKPAVPFQISRRTRKGSQ